MPKPRVIMKRVRAEADAKAQLKSSYNRFLSETEPAQKNAAGRNLIRSIFGKDSLFAARVQ